MPRNDKSERAKPLMESKPGGGEKAKLSQGDFGVKESDEIEREYASRATRNQDPGGLQTRANDETGGRRDAGVGRSGGAGANSGGDLDADVVGVGTGGVGTSSDVSKQHEPGPDDAVIDRPASSTRNKSDRLTERDDPPRGSVIPRENGEALDDEGADAVRTDAGKDDPFKNATAGEVSAGEASGSDSSSSSAKR